MTTTAKALTRVLTDRFGLPAIKDDLLDLALRHASVDRHRNNQRLEFLGDRVLGLIVAELLYEAYPDEPEGDLAVRHAALVRADTLAEIARDLNLGTFLTLGESNSSGNLQNLNNVLADALEALIGAIYLSAGVPAAQTLITALWQPQIKGMARPPQDPKSALQEWAQGRGLPLPTYTLETREGPDHAPVFRIKVTLPNTDGAIGEGPSRRLAEKQAAQNLLTRLREEIEK